LLYAILLSTALFNVAFFFQNMFGWLIFFFPVPLWLFFRRNFYTPAYPPQVAHPEERTLVRVSKGLMGSKSKNYFKYGLLWGALVFGFHFTWTVQLLFTHSHAPWWLCLIAYSILVFYFALSSGLWFVCAGLLKRLLVLCKFRCATSCALFISILGYWWFLDGWVLFPVGLGRGYPFVNPLIPLASYRWFLHLLGIVFGGVVNQAPLDLPLTYVAPVVNRIKNVDAVWKSNPYGVSKRIEESLDKASHSIVLSPESSFLFPLNHYQHLVDRWCNKAPENSHLFIGSLYQAGSHLYQAVFWLHKSLIIKVYVKKHLTPFVEKIPDQWRGITALKEAFLRTGSEFSDVKPAGTADVFDVTPNVRLIPRLCLEFFVYSSRAEFDCYKDPTKTVAIAFFVNDSWFNRYFRTTLVNLTRLKCQLIGLPVVYIGHYGCTLINPCQPV